MLPSRVSGLSHLLLVRLIWNHIAACSTYTQITEEPAKIVIFPDRPVRA